MLFLTIRLYARYERIKERHESTKDERERERERERVRVKRKNKKTRKKRPKRDNGGQTYS